MNGTVSSTISPSSLPITYIGNNTDLPSAPVSKESDGQTALILLGCLVVLFILGLLFVVGYMLVRKTRLDRLRHHLMPLYNFDPAEEGEDWEVELLDEAMEHQAQHRGYKSMDYPTTENTELFRR